ncbi:MAG: AAA family ATPase [Planctomycetales bacterium]|nr:AAA family ATPase [Planctomycetales bacterium]
MVQTLNHPRRQPKDRASSRPSHTVCELVGPAGAGKSTLARSLCESTPVETTLGIEFSRAAALRGWAKTMLSLYSTQLRQCRGSRWLNRDEQRFIFLLGGWRQHLEDTRNSNEHSRLTIIDHGPVFRLTYLRIYGPRVTQTRRFQKWSESMLSAWSALLDTIIYLDAPDDVLAARVCRRTSDCKGLKSHSLSEARDCILRFRQGYAETLDALARHGGPRVVRLDSSRCSPESIAARVRTELEVAL